MHSETLKEEMVVIRLTSRIYFFLLSLLFASAYVALVWWNSQDVAINLKYMLRKSGYMDQRLSEQLTVNRSSLCREFIDNVVLSESVPFPEVPELSNEEFLKEEHSYSPDDQYLKYKVCPTSLRHRLANNSVLGHKYIEDMPILMWDKHLTPSEYKRMFRFREINGFLNMSYNNISSTVHRLTTDVNKYMFDDLLPRKDNATCIRCAIVGNGGILNGSKKGKEIDDHDYVFRVNTALTKSFEEDVGSRTSFYCFTMGSLSNTLAGSRRFGFLAPPSPSGIKYLFFATNEWTYTFLGAHFQGKKPPRSPDKYNRIPPIFSIPLTPDNVKIVHPDFERYLKWSWVNSTHQHRHIHRPTTGGIMLLTSLHICDEVNAYGFGGNYTKYSDHYYESKFSRHKFYANHDDNTESKLWHLLDKEKIISLYTRDEDTK